MVAVFEEVTTRQRYVFYDLGIGDSIEVPPGFACALLPGPETQIVATSLPEVGVPDLAEPYELLNPRGEELPSPIFA
jgi:hypothetical protein